MHIRANAFEGESVSVTDLLADSLALTGSATLDGLTAQGNVGCDQLLRNRELHRRVHHGRGRLGRSLLRLGRSLLRSAHVPPKKKTDDDTTTQLQS